MLKPLERWQERPGSSFRLVWNVTDPDSISSHGLGVSSFDLPVASGKVGKGLSHQILGKLQKDRNPLRLWSW